MQDQYVETYKNLLKNIKDNQNKWRVITWFWLRRASVLMTLISSKLFYKSIEIKTPYKQNILWNINSKICLEKEIYHDSQKLMGKI